jgi:flagellar motor switch protein FliM
MNIQPFRFKLKKVPPKEVRVLSALFDFLPKTGVRDKFHEAIHEVLDKHLGMETAYSLEGVSQTTFDQALERMPDPAVLVVLGMAPREGKIIVEIDNHLAALFIEKLLGGSGETLPEPRPLSDTEQGVLQYLILQILSHLYRLCGNDARLHFRFEKFVFLPKLLKGAYPPDEAVSALTMNLKVGGHGGYVKMFFPSPVVEQQYLNVEAKGGARESEREFMLERLREFGFVSVPLWGEAGHTTVTAADLKNLETGDVILFDSTQMMLTDSGPAGRTILRTGEGRHGGFLAEASFSPRKVECRIIDVSRGEDIIK